MTDTIDHGAQHDGTRRPTRSAGFADEAQDPPFKTLSREEAQALRVNLPQVSPWRVVAAQAAAGLLCTAIAWLVTQRSGAAWSALYGALAVALPGALLARGMTRRTGSAVAAAAGFLFWEMLKIGVAIAMLVIAAKVVLTMVVCMKVNWVALLWRAR